ncbi:hypothetical protein C4577_00625 [Candidatus Parcubacteria bacterium]|nr:MAG: hypothetical protein C4577_00625 [Candidatus Parcubacteria bacterium]
MKLILIDGGPASGKNTLGNLLVEKFQKLEQRAVLLDLDTYVEEFNPSWVWEDKEREKEDQLNARINFAQDINKYLQENFIVIAIGERFLTKENVIAFVEKVKINCSVYLFHLSIPISLRKQRLHKRGPHSLIDLEKDQRDRDEVKSWPGYVYENINSPEEDASNLFQLIQNDKGLFILL